MSSKYVVNVIVAVAEHTGHLMDDFLETAQISVSE